jgi:hypothetical protein
MAPCQTTEGGWQQRKIIPDAKGKSSIASIRKDPQPNEMNDLENHNICVTITTSTLFVGSPQLIKNSCCCCCKAVITLMVG